MKPKVEDFPALVRWVAERYHNGVIDQISKRAGISPALADKWSKGQVRRPTIETLEKFCQAYGLNFNWVRSLLRRAAALLVFLLAAVAYPADASVPSQVMHYKPLITKNAIPLIGSCLVGLLRWATSAAVRFSPIAQHCGARYVNA